MRIFQLGIGLVVSLAFVISCAKEDGSGNLDNSGPPQFFMADEEPESECGPLTQYTYDEFGAVVSKTKNICVCNGRSLEIESESWIPDPCSPDPNSEFGKSRFKVSHSTWKRKHDSSTCTTSTSVERHERNTQRAKYLVDQKCDGKPLKVCGYLEETTTITRFETEDIVGIRYQKWDKKYCPSGAVKSMTKLSCYLDAKREEQCSPDK